MGIDDLVNQGKQHYEAHKDKIDGFLNSEQAEAGSDKIFDSAADIAKKISPDQFDAKVDDVRAEADRHVGTEGDGGDTSSSDERQHKAP
jgi:hypothetical protein